MSRARTIIVGAAHWHVPLYAAAVAEVHRVVGVSDEHPERVRDLAELWGVPVETDWRRLLELPDVELAYVFGPHDQMAQTCLALIERRIPFVVEKPLGTSLEELQQVRQAAEEAGVPATVPLIQRRGPADSWLAKAGTAGVSTALVHGRPTRAVQPQRQPLDARRRAGRRRLPGQPWSAFHRPLPAAQRQYDRRRRSEAVEHPAHAGRSKTTRPWS